MLLGNKLMPETIPQANKIHRIMPNLKTNHKRISVSVYHPLFDSDSGVLDEIGMASNYPAVSFYVEHL